MRILFPHPKKSSWKLERAVWPDGRSAILVCEPVSGDGGARRLAHPSIHGARIETLSNSVVEAAIKITGTIDHRRQPMFAVIERDGQLVGLGYHGLEPMELGVSAMADILMAVGDGRLRVEGGWITGRFTFAKGAEVRLVAWDGPADTATPYGDAGDAPDLSDLVATLTPKG